MKATRNSVPPGSSRRSALDSAAARLTPAERAERGRAARSAVPRDRHSAYDPSADRPDPGGSALSILGLGLLLWAIIEAPTEGWGSPVVISVGLASIVTLGAFVGWEARSDHPMLKLSFFRDRRFAIAAAAECLGLFGLFGGLFVQTQFLQFELGYSPLQAGLRILPVAAAVVVSSPLAMIAARFAGARLTAAIGLAAIAGGLWQASAASTTAATYGAVLPGMLAVGVGAGLLLSTATNSLVGSLPQRDAGVGSATNGVAIQVGGALGVREPGQGPWSNARPWPR